MLHIYKAGKIILTVWVADMENIILQEYLSKLEEKIKQLEAELFYTKERVKKLEKQVVLLWAT